MHEPIENTLWARAVRDREPTPASLARRKQRDVGSEGQEVVADTQCSFVPRTHPLAHGQPKAVIERCAHAEELHEACNSAGTPRFHWRSTRPRWAAGNPWPTAWRAQCTCGRRGQTDEETATHYTRAHHPTSPSAPMGSRSLFRRMFSSFDR